MRRAAGFTLIELMIVVVIIGILAAMGIIGYQSLMDRAREGSTKANMHSLQLAAEDYGAQHDGAYCSDPAVLVSLMPYGGVNFRNPFTHTSGTGVAFEQASAWQYPITTSGVAGIVSYMDTAGLQYQVVACGRHGDFPLVLGNGHD